MKNGLRPMCHIRDNSITNRMELNYDWFKEN